MLFFFSNIFCGTLNKPFGIVFLRRKNHNLFSALLNYKTSQRSAPSAAPLPHHRLHARITPSHIFLEELFFRVFWIVKNYNDRSFLFFLLLSPANSSFHFVFSSALRHRGIVAVFFLVPAVFIAQYITLAVEILYTEWKAAHTDKRAQTKRNILLCKVDIFRMSLNTFAIVHSRIYSRRESIIEYTSIKGVRSEIKKPNEVDCYFFDDWVLKVGRKKNESENIYSKTEYIYKHADCLLEHKFFRNITKNCGGHLNLCKRAVMRETGPLVIALHF